jgi:hypothetical protein
MRASSFLGRMLFIVELIQFYSLSGLWTVLNAVNKYIVTEICPLYGLRTVKDRLKVLYFRVFTNT